MDMEFQKYELSQTIFDHVAVVRSVTTSGSLLLTASSDKTARLYQQVDSKFELVTVINFFDNYLYSSCARKGGFAVGCGNTIYFIDSQGSPEAVLKGHDSQVCSLYSIDDNTLISGSWDATAIVWIDQNQQHRLRGHKYGVAVYGKGDLYITGSQDGILRQWQGETQTRTVQAHSDIIREIQECAVGYVTCSNDETVKLWSSSLELIASLLGHTGFVFSVKVLGDLFISGSDDRSACIWRGSDQLQKLSLPCTVWTVCPTELKDIVVGCEDGKVRIFTSEPARRAPQDQIDQLEQDCTIRGVQGGEGLSQEELNKMPSVQQLSILKGKKNGEIRLFKNGSNPEAYMWDHETSVWNKIGDVLGGQGTNKKKFVGDKYFPAGEYDYIFDVEDDNGLTKKLPFNDGESHMAIAEKFCLREGYSKHYMQQVINFLKQNTKAAVKAPVQNQVVHYNYIPYTQYFLYESMNLAGLTKKLGELNSQAGDLALTDKELMYFNRAIEQLSQIGAQQSGKIDFTICQLLQNKLFKWKSELLLPVYDFMRLFTLHHSSEQIFSSLDKGINIFLDIQRLIQEASSPVLVRLLLQVLVNNLHHNANSYSSLQYIQIVCDTILTQKTSTDPKNHIIIANLILNLSIAIYQKPQFNQQASEILSKTIQQYLSSPRDAETTVKIVTSIGNLMMCPNQAQKDQCRLNINLDLLFLATETDDQRNCVEEVKKALK